MHVLVGALIGAAVGVALAVIVAKIMRQPITWKTIAAGAVGGAVAGAITAATLGTGEAAAVTAFRAATAYVAGGAGGGGAGRATENVLDKKPIGQGVPEATAIGGASGLLFYGAGRALGPVLEKVAARIPFRLPGSASEPEAPKAPEWETYPYRVKPPANPGETVRVKIADLRTRQATIDYGNGHYSETELYDPVKGVRTTDPTTGRPMIPDVSWVDWIDGEEPFWAVREGNHRTFDAMLQGREDVLANVVFFSRETAENAALFGDREYVPFPRSGVWGMDDRYLGDAADFQGTGYANPFRPAVITKTQGVVGALGK